MTALQTIAISIISSTVTVGVLSFIVKAFFKQAIEHEFKKKSLDYEKQKELEFLVRGSVIETRLGVYPEIGEVVYRIKNLAQKAVTINAPFTWGKPQFSDYCYHLTENLYKYRIFLPEETFTTLHEFKRVGQDFLLRADSVDRPENLTESSQFPEETLNVLKTLCAELDTLASTILQALQEQVDNGLQNRVE